MLDARCASLLALSLIAVALPACGDERPPPAPTAVAPAPPDAVTATPAAAPPAAPPAPADPGPTYDLPPGCLPLFPGGDVIDGLTALGLDVLRHQAGTVALHDGTPTDREVLVVPVGVTTELPFRRPDVKPGMTWWSGQGSLLLPADSQAARDLARDVWVTTDAGGQARVTPPGAAEGAALRVWFDGVGDDDGQARVLAFGARGAAHVALYEDVYVRQRARAIKDGALRLEGLLTHDVDGDGEAELVVWVAHGEEVEHAELGVIWPKTRRIASWPITGVEGGVSWKFMALVPPSLDGGTATRWLGLAECCGARDVTSTHLTTRGFSRTDHASGDHDEQLCLVPRPGGPARIVAVKPKP